MPFKLGTKRHVYKLVDYNNENVKGSWYLEELQEISDNQYAWIKSCGGVLYLTAKKNICSVKSLDRKIQLVNNGNRQVRCRR